MLGMYDALGFMPAPNKYIGQGGSAVKDPLPVKGWNAWDGGEQLPKCDTETACVTPKGGVKTERPGPVGLIPSFQCLSFQPQA